LFWVLVDGEKCYKFTYAKVDGSGESGTLWILEIMGDSMKTNPGFGS